MPDFDPKGLGVAGILTSEFFNLPSSMDEESFNNLSKKRELEVLEREGILSEEQRNELQSLIKKLEKIGLESSQRDPLYEKFVKAIYENPDLKRPALDLDERKIQNDKMAELLKQIMDEEKDL
jgi:hypothetical protein